MGKVKVGLKYCGGCNPDYDRVKAVEYIKEQLGDAIELVPAQTEDTDMVLVVEGCEVCCVDLAPFSSRPVIIVKSEEDAQSFVREIKARYEH
ncbi:MAG: hypothetical protein DRG37_01085 [Deltaproteobacteria bacterium]|nr:MAG: hypothetical protein DRG37_01085 [Deltaproteobacteria bacterium]